MSYLTLAQAENVFWSTVVQALKLDPDTTAPDRVRIAWPTFGQPGWNRDEDRMFLLVSESDQSINRERDVIWESTAGDYAIKRTGQIRVWQLDIIAYGPNSYDDQIRVRNMLFAKPFTVNGKTFDIPRYLRENGLYIIPDISAPTRSPEIFGGNWWQRADMRVFFNERVIYEDEHVPYFKAAKINITNQQPSAKNTEIARSDEQDVIIEP